MKRTILDQINGRMGPSLSQKIFPNNLEAYSPRVVSANFMDLGSGKLGLDLVFAASISQQEVSQALPKALQTDGLQQNLGSSYRGLPVFSFYE